MSFSERKVLTFFTIVWVILLAGFLIFTFPAFWFAFFNFIPFLDRLSPSGESKPFGWIDTLTYIFIFYLILYFLSYKNEKLANALIKKASIIAGFTGMLLSRDFTWKHVPAPDVIRHSQDKQVRRIIFIRHGESEWNEIFNRGFGLGFFGRLGRGLMKELSLLNTRDSVFLDASLSAEGMEQIEELHHFLSKPVDRHSSHYLELIETLRGDRGVKNSIIVSSNLRRAIATAVIGMQKRVQKTKEQIYIMSSLQEISRNVDANAISGPQEIPDLHVIKERVFEGFTKFLNATMNFGQKPLFRSNGFKRIRNFCEWGFSQPKETIIVGGGHSFYFREFFRCFADVKEHDSKTFIMRNGAVVSFVLESAKENGLTYYRIPPESIQEIFGGREGESRAFKVAKKSS